MEMQLRKVLVQLAYYYLLIIVAFSFFLLISSFNNVFDGGKRLIDDWNETRCMLYFVLLLYQLGGLYAVIVLRRVQIDVVRWKFGLRYALLFFFFILPTLMWFMVAIKSISFED